MAKPKISVIIPVFNEETNIEQLLIRLDSVFSSNIGHVEVIFVDDGSTDNTAGVLKTRANSLKWLRLIELSRNFGNQAAVTAGLDHCSGDCAVIIDGDLQDPPEVIPKMIEKWQEGYEVVYAQRQKRKGETFFKRASAAFFYRLLQRMTDVDIPKDTGDFRLIDRKVIEALAQMPERNRFLRGMVSWAGFRQTSVPYEREERFSGETKYPFFKMLKFALTGITSFSFLPLQLASYFGFFISGISFIAAIYVLYLKYFTDRTIQGWTSMMIALLFLGGIQLITLGIIGEYIGRMSDEVKQRPAYLIRKKVNLD